MNELLAGLAAVLTHLAALLVGLIVSPFLAALHLAGVVEMD